jgi:glycosyltransferase involved in cell wall biosynthesis
MRAAGGVQAEHVGTQAAGQVGRTTPDCAPGNEGDAATPDGLPGVSVVVATRGRAHFLEPLVHAVLSDPGALELIIVVDGADDPESLGVLRQLSRTNGRLRPTQADRLGQMGALDHGVLMARGDVVLLLDDDVLPVSPLATGHARRHARRGDLVVVGTMPVRVIEGRRLKAAGRIYAQAYHEHCAALIRGEGPVLDSLWFGNVSLRREHCLRVGLRSKAFTSRYHADREFGYRLAEAGLTGVFDASLRAVHLHSRSDEAFLRDACRRGSGLRLLHQVHADRLGPFSPHLVLDTRFRLLNAALRGTLVKSGTRGAVSKALMDMGSMAGRVHLQAVETLLAKVAQHIMQWHGAVGAAGD